MAAQESFMKKKLMEKAIIPGIFKAVINDILSILFRSRVASVFPLLIESVADWSSLASVSSSFEFRIPPSSILSPTYDGYSTKKNKLMRPTDITMALTI